MLGDDEFVLPSAFARPGVLVRLARPGDPRQSASNEQAFEVHRTVAELKFGLSVRDPGLTAFALQLQRELAGALGIGRLPISPRRGVSERFADALGDELELAFERGLLVVELNDERILERTELRPSKLPDVPALPRPPAAPGDTFYDVRFVDEVGQGITGLEVAFNLGEDSPTVTTNAAGVALLQGVRATSGTVSVQDIAALEKTLLPRWGKRRAGAAPTGGNLAQRVFAGSDPGAFPVKSVAPHTIVLTPRLGKLHMRLVDKWNRTVHAERNYQIAGPVPLSGKTDEGGVLLHKDVPFGDYQLTLQLDDGKSAAAAAVVISPEEGFQVRRVAAVQNVELARLKGLFFETNKSFLLPASVAVFDRVRAIYERNEPSKLLIVGHTDTTGQPAINDPLSLERANNTRAFLFDDVDGWLENYTTAIPEGRRWTGHEDGLMIESLPDFTQKSDKEESVRWFQRTRNLKVDGIAGDLTRRELVKEYMGLDGASLLDREIEVTTHGCGEHFPLDDSQDDVDPNLDDGKEDQADRRVELFFFDPDFGIQPPPPGDNSRSGDTQYLQWRKAAKLNEQLELGAQTVQVTVVDEAGAALPNLNFSIVTDTRRVINGTLDGAGKARVPIFRTTPATFSVQGVDETSLAPAPASADGDVVTAALLAAGMTVSPGVPTVITVGLGEVLVSTDVTPDDDANLQFVLESSDGAFTQTIAASAGNASDGGSDFLFTGLPTVGKSYTFSFVDDVGKTAIFQGVDFADLAGLGVAQGPDLIDPTAGDPDGRMSTLVDASDDDVPGSSGSANA